MLVSGGVSYTQVLSYHLMLSYTRISTVIELVEKCKQSRGVERLVRSNESAMG